MIPIAEGLYTDEAEPRLIGGHNRTTGRIVFPCPNDEQFEATPLGRQGTLWSFTVQRFRPKSPPYAGPEAFSPWAIGYVELPGETIVEARLTNVPLDQIRIGMPLRLTFIPLDPDADKPVMLYAFEPTAAEELAA